MLYVLFNIMHEPKIVAYIAQRVHERGGTRPPVLTESYWAVLYGLSRGIERFKQTFFELQLRLLLVCQQRHYIEQLITDMIQIFNVKRVDDDELDDLPANSTINIGDWYIQRESLVEFIMNEGSRAKAHFTALDNDEKVQVLNHIARFAMTSKRWTVRREATLPKTRRRPACRTTWSPSGPPSLSATCSNRAALVCSRTNGPRTTFLRDRGGAPRPHQGVQRRARHHGHNFKA